MSTRRRASARALRWRVRILLLVFYAALVVIAVVFSRGSDTGRITCMAFIIVLGLALPVGDYWRSCADTREKYAKDATPGVCSICSGSDDEKDCPAPQEVGEAITRRPEEA